MKQEKKQYKVKSGKDAPGMLMVGKTSYLPGQSIFLTEEEYEQNKRFVDSTESPDQQAKEKK